MREILIDVPIYITSKLKASHASLVDVSSLKMTVYRKTVLLGVVWRSCTNWKAVTAKAIYEYRRV